MKNHSPTPPPEPSKPNPPTDKAAVDGTKDSSTPLKGDHETKPPRPSSGDTVSLDDILSFNGNKLWYTVAKLSRSPGRRRRAAFKEPDYDAMTEAATKLCSNSKGCSRLRDLIGMGLQMGDLPAGREGVWAVIIHLADTFLRRVPYPRPPSLSSQRGPYLSQAYGTTWGKVCEEAANKAKSGGGTAIKFLQNAQEILLLDAFSAFCSSKFAEEDFLRALSLLRLPDEVADPTHGQFLWSFPAIIATGIPAGIQIIQGGTLHERFEKLTTDLAATGDRLGETEARNKELKQELHETKEALDEEIQLLNKEQAITEKLRRDVMTAGSINKHKLDEMRGRFKGMLEGDLGRHLKTLQTCVEMDPPRTKVAIERVETLLGILNRELKWLEDSE